MVFTSYPFSNRESLSGPSLLLVDPEIGSIYNWHGLVHARNHYWTSKQDTVLVSTGGTYAGEKIKPFLLTSVGDIQQIDDAFGDGILSPDGKKIAYLDHFSLMIYDLTTQETTKLTRSSVWAYHFSWSPDSNYIVFESPDEVHMESQSYEIIQVNINDRSLLPLTDQINDNDAINLQWSADGTMLSFGNPSRIVFTNEQRSYEIPEFANHCQPLLHFSAWLHHGSKLSMFCESENNTGQLWILDTKTNSANFIREFTELNLREGIWPEMSWSSDDTKLAFTTVRKNAHCASTWEGMPLCPEDIYIYNNKTDILKKIALKNWLNGIRDLEWLQASDE